MRPAPPAHWTRAGHPTAPAGAPATPNRPTAHPPPATTWSAATASDTTASRHHPAGVVTVRDCTVDAEPTMAVRCVVGAMARDLTPAIDPVSCPTIADGRDGISRRIPDGAVR